MTAQRLDRKEGSIASKVSNWLDGGAKDARAFVIEDQLFEPGSVELTDDGQVRLKRFIDLVKVNGLNASLFVTTYEGVDAAQKQQLATKRADHLAAR